VKQPILYVAILLSGATLGGLHYKLKPRLDEKAVNEYAQNMSNSIDWQGQIAPDFQLDTTQGERFQLSEKVGKETIVLNFFATWCGPCREEMPELNRYFDEHKEQSFLLVGIDAEEKPERVEEFRKELKLDFPVVVDQGEIRKQYGVTAFPTTVVIGVDGKVQFYETGALVNAEVAFDNLVQKNRQALGAGKGISTQDYRVQAQKQHALPVHQFGEAQNQQVEENPLDERGKRIATRMDCPCGCEKKVQMCTCATSKNIKKALATEDFKQQPDDEIMRSLNKRFCSGAM
jgi:peroxiredoxin